MIVPSDDNPNLKRIHTGKKETEEEENRVKEYYITNKENLVNGPRNQYHGKNGNQMNEAKKDWKCFEM